jgi:hypothetical protein
MEDGSVGEDDEVDDDMSITAVGTKGSNNDKTTGMTTEGGVGSAARMDMEDGLDKENKEGLGTVPMEGVVAGDKSVAGEGEVGSDEQSSSKESKTSSKESDTPTKRNKTSDGYGDTPG